MGIVVGCRLGSRSGRICTVVRRRLGQREGGLRVVTSRGVMDCTIVRTRNDILAGGCTRKCPKGHCCNNYRCISGLRRLTVSHTERLFNTSRMGMRPRSNSRTGFTICCKLLGPNSVILKVGLASNKRLARNDPIGMSKGCFGMLPCNIERSSRLLSCSTVRGLTGRMRPGVVVKKASTCSHVVSFREVTTITRRINTLLVVSVTRFTKLITKKRCPDPIP